MTDWIAFGAGGTAPPTPGTVTVPPSEIPPGNPPLPVTDWISFNQPYFLSGNTRRIGIIAVRPNPGQQFGFVYLGNSRRSQRLMFQPRKIFLTSEMSLLDKTTATFSSQPEDGLLMIANSSQTMEFVRKTGNSLERGLGDTVPLVHAPNTPVWALKYLWSSIDLGTDLLVSRWRITTFTDRELPLADATQQVVFVSNRINQPICPANLYFNGEQFPTRITNDLNVSYNSRNRRVQSRTSLLDWYSGTSAVPETNATIWVRVEATDGIGTTILNRSAIAQRVDLFTYTAAEISAMVGGSPTARLDITVSARRDGLFSYSVFELSVTWHREEGTVLRFRDLAEPSRPPQIIDLQFRPLVAPAPPTPTMVDLQFRLVTRIDEGPTEPEPPTPPVDDDRGWHYNWGNDWGEQD